MSGSRVYEFHQKEIADLKTAAVYTAKVCDDLKRLLEGIRDNQPNGAHWAIKEFLDHNNQLESRLNPVEHLIVPVGVPVMVPRYKECRWRNDGTYADLPSLTCSEMREYAVAHLAAWAVHRLLRDYLWDVWRRGHPELLACNDVRGAADELVGSRWQEIRDELEAIVDYDCDGLRQAVEAESKAAMERCRQSIVGDPTATLKPGIDKPVGSSRAMLPKANQPVDKTTPALLIDFERLTVTWKTHTWDVRSELALRWLKVLADNEGKWITAPDLCNHDNELDGVRTDRLKKHIPKQVLELIEPSKRHGSRLILPGQ